MPTLADHTCRIRSFIFTLFIAVAVAVLVNRLSAAPARVVLLDGTSMDTVIAEIDEDGTIVGQDLPKDLDLFGLRSINRLGASTVPARSAFIIELAGNVQVRADDVTLRDETFHVNWNWGGDVVEIPIEFVRAIRFAPEVKNTRFETALNTSADDDMLFVEIENRIHSFSGVLESLAADEIAFDIDGKSAKFPRNKVHGIVLAALGDDPLKNVKVTVTFNDGTSLHGLSTTFKDDVLNINTSKSARLSMPWEKVASVLVRSDRLAFLSDLEPTEVDEESIVTTSQPWQRNLSVGKRPLTLAHSEGRETRQFSNGLGTHARCSLSYKAGKRFNVFAATIGIDAETRGRGDCEFVVLGDGKELYRQRVTGKDEPRDIKVDITDVEEVTLVVEPGVDLDLADHADWCDARFILSKK